MTKPEASEQEPLREWLYDELLDIDGLGLMPERREFIANALAPAVARKIAEARRGAIEEAAKVVDGVPENLERHWQLSNLDMLLLKAIALKIRALEAS